MSNTGVNTGVNMLCRIHASWRNVSAAGAQIALAPHVYEPEGAPQIAIQVNTTLRRAYHRVA